MNDSNMESSSSHDDNAGHKIGLGEISNLVKEPLCEDNIYSYCIMNDSKIENNSTSQDDHAGHEIGFGGTSNLESKSLCENGNARENKIMPSKQEMIDLKLSEGVIVQKELIENPDNLSCSLINENESKKEDTSQNNKSTDYRCDNSDSWSEDDDSSSTLSISSSDSDTFFHDLHDSSGPKAFPDVKTKGELDLDDLPPIEDLEISVTEEEMEKIGVIHAIVDKLVVIHSLKDSRPLDSDSVLFLSPDKPIGRVFEVFGPVVEPFYTVRFNSVEDINKKGIEVELEVFYAPNKSDITSYVFVNELQSQRGSDASWKDNNEPPEECLDYSDDEEEKAARRKRMAKNRNRSTDNALNADIAFKRPSLERGSADRPILLHSPHPTASHNFNNSNNNNNNSSYQFRRPNPFSQPPPHSLRPRLPSLLHLRSPMASPLPSPALPLYSPQPQLPLQQQQHSFQHPPQSPFLLAAYPTPHVFGQIPAIGPVSPALHAPSPLFNNIPSLIPARSPSTPQNYFNQRILRSPSPALQNNRLSPDPWIRNSTPMHFTGNLPPNVPIFNNISALIPAHSPSPSNPPPNTPIFNNIPAHSQPLSNPPPTVRVFNTIPALIPAHSPSPSNPQNYFYPRMPQSPSPSLQRLPEPWQSNNAPMSFAGNYIPPNTPLSVQIPTNSSRSPRPINQFEQPRVPQPFVNQTMNFPNGSAYPRFR